MGLYSCGNIDLLDYTAVGTYVFGTIQLWEHRTVGLFRNTELWVYTAGGTYSCGTIQLWEHRAVWLQLLEHTAVWLYSCVNIELQGCFGSTELWDYTAVTPNFEAKVRPWTPPPRTTGHWLSLYMCVQARLPCFWRIRHRTCSQPSLKKLMGCQLSKKKLSFFTWGGDVVQLVEHQVNTPLRQVGFPRAVKDFSPSQLSVQTLFWCLYSPRVQSHTLTLRAR